MAACRARRHGLAFLVGAGGAAGVLVHMESVQPRRQPLQLRIERQAVRRLGDAHAAQRRGSGIGAAQLDTHFGGQRQRRGGAQQGSEDGGILGGLKDIFLGTTGPRGGKHEGLVQAAAKSAVRTIGTQLGKEILRGVLGGIFGGKR